MPIPSPVDMRIACRMLSAGGAKSSSKRRRETMVMRERRGTPIPLLRRQARDLSLVGKYRKAAQLYQELLQRSPHDAQAALHLAELRRRIGDPSGARSAYRQAIALYLDAGWDEKALAVESAL